MQARKGGIGENGAQLFPGEVAEVRHKGFGVIPAMADAGLDGGVQVGQPGERGGRGRLSGGRLSGHIGSVRGGAGHEERRQRWSAALHSGSRDAGGDSLGGPMSGLTKPRPSAVGSQPNAARTGCQPARCRAAVAIMPFTSVRLSPCRLMSSSAAQVVGLIARTAAMNLMRAAGGSLGDIDNGTRWS
ncbi:hypothetical protein C7W88_04835 [Novosphingobium sp. THN1]|nr:hypothetical protein C7W88_04835 [Novosphingobium sp. THN1]